MDSNKFDIVIKYKNAVPVSIDNPILKYEQDENRKSNRLLVEVYYDGILIGKGIILDFYKKFEIKTGYRGEYTKASKHTPCGNKIYKIKFYKNPPISERLKEVYINNFIENFSCYIEQITTKLKDEDLCITCIPSSTKTPDMIAEKLSSKFGLSINDLIYKNERLGESKSIEDYYDSMEHSQEKYSYNTDYIKEHKDHRYLIIDDVMGVGSSIIRSLKTIYDITQKMNYFFCVVKDVKR